MVKVFWTKPSIKDFKIISDQEEIDYAIRVVKAD